MNDTIIQSLISASRGHVIKRLWMVSDLQQSQPERAERCMTIAMDDFLSLDMPADAVCYLGDATEGSDAGYVREMAAMQQKQFARQNAPVYYAIGNHDFDYYRCRSGELDRMVIPFVEYMRTFPQWHFQQDIRQMHYMVDMGPFVLCVLTDHASPDGEWYTTHGLVHGNENAYPYTEADYKAVMAEIAAIPKPVITCSHYSFAGGNRAAPLFDMYMPLPRNVRIHIYGHSHIGDAKWGGKDVFRKLSFVDDQAIVQADIASLESGRGNSIRSAFLEWYDSGEIGLLFRNHEHHCWDDCFLQRESESERRAWAEAQ